MHVYIDLMSICIWLILTYYTGHHKEGETEHTRGKKIWNYQPHSCSSVLHILSDTGGCCYCGISLWVYKSTTATVLLLLFLPQELLLLTV